MFSIFVDLRLFISLYLNHGFIFLYKECLFIKPKIEFRKIRTLHSITTLNLKTWYVGTIVIATGLTNFFFQQQTIWNWCFWVRKSWTNYPAFFNLKQFFIQKSFYFQNNSSDKNKWFLMLVQGYARSMLHSVRHTRIIRTYMHRN